MWAQHTKMLSVGYTEDDYNRFDENTGMLGGSNGGGIGVLEDEQTDDTGEVPFAKEHIDSK